MKYVITGSLGNISKPLVQKLVAAGHEVMVVSSKHEKVEQIEAMKARAAVGSVTDIAFLSRIFNGADAVYTMVPPFLGAPDWKKYIGRIGENYAEAIKISGVKHVVNLSSIGAHMPDGCGPVSGLYFVEKALNALADVNMKHLRPGFFFANLFGQISMIKQAGIMGGNYGDQKMVMVHTDDIAAAAAEELLDLSFEGKSVRYISSDIKKPQEVASIIGKAIGKPDLQWINFSEEDTKAGMVQAGFPEEIASNYAKMGTAMRSGEMTSDYMKLNPTIFGKIKLEDFAQTFAQVFRQS